MTTMNKLRELDVKDSGKALRAGLKSAFPGTKFSVRMSRGTGWGNFHVSWTDGPTSEQVGKITERHAHQGFDGMTDSTTYHDAPVDYKGERVLSTCGLILPTRTISDEMKAEMTTAIAVLYPADTDLPLAARSLAYNTVGGATPTEEAIAKAAHQYAN